MRYIKVYEEVLDITRAGGPGDLVFMEKHYQEWIDLRDSLLKAAGLSLEDITK